jgi:hypothetical protein
MVGLFVDDMLLGLAKIRHVCSLAIYLLIGTCARICDSISGVGGAYVPWARHICALAKALGGEGGH